MLIKAALIFFALACHLVTLASTALFILFLHGSLPSTWLQRPTESRLEAIIIDLGLVVLWSLQHTGMASAAFKQWSGRFVPLPLERTVYCLFTAIAISVLILGWIPMPGSVYNMESRTARGLVDIGFWTIWSLFFVTLVLDRYLEFFGIKQVYCEVRGRPFSMSSFKTKHFHRFVRHPTLTFIILGVWVTPEMSLSHLSFAALMTIYTVLGALSVDKKFVRYYGLPYVRRQQEVPLLFPDFPFRRKN